MMTRKKTKGWQQAVVTMQVRSLPAQCSAVPSEGLRVTSSTPPGGVLHCTALHCVISSFLRCTGSHHGSSNWMRGAM
jgi:hypothetical protein